MSREVDQPSQASQEAEVVRIVLFTTPGGDLDEFPWFRCLSSRRRQGRR
jgi:hypothetical protein